MTIQANFLSNLPGVFSRPVLGKGFIAGFVAVLLIQILAKYFFPKAKALPHNTGSLLNFFKRVTGLQAPGVHKELMQSFMQFGPIFKSYFLTFPVICVCEPKTVRNVLAKEFDGVKQGWLPSMRRLLMAEVSPGFSLDRDMHKAYRKDFGTLLSADYLRQHIAEIARIADSYVSKWIAQRDVGAFEECKQYTLAVICSVVIGLEVSLESMESFRTLAKDWTKGFFTLGINLPGTTFHKALQAQRKICEKISEQIKKDKQGAAVGKEDLKGRRTLLQQAVHLKDGTGISSYSSENIMAVVLAFLFAGHDTTASLLNRTLQALVLNPEVLKKAQEEQEEVILKMGEQYSMEALDCMVYLDAVIKEAFRLYPIVPQIPRTTTQDIEVHGYTLPKNSRMMLLANPVHSRAQQPSTQFAETYTETLGQGFNPERWLRGTRVPLEFMPWGSGPRLCLGKTLATAEAKVMLATMIRRCSWKSVLGEVFFPETLDELTGPDHGVPLQIFAK